MQTNSSNFATLDKAFNNVANYVTKCKDITHSDTPWHKLGCDIEADDFIVYGDINAAIMSRLVRSNVKVHVWHPSTEAVDFLSTTPFRDIEKVKNKGDMTNNITKMNKCVIRTNVAFTISKEMIADTYPLIMEQLNVIGTQTILPSDGVLGISGSGFKHEQGVKTLKSLKHMGLKTVKHLPLRFFNRVEDGKLDKAQTGIIYVETEKNYAGPITVHCLITNESYIADRDADLLPRSEFAYKVSRKAKYAKSNLPKEKLAQNAKISQLVELNNLYTVEISHYANKYKDSITGEFSSLPNANLVMPGTGTGAFNGYENDHLLYGFNTLLEAQSFQSLLAVPEFARACIDLAFKKQRVSGPTLKLAAEIFPWDRIWDSQQVINYVG
jgi:hypothetical protein